MKKVFFNLALILMVMLTVSSCYTYTHTVGNGSQTGKEVTKKNHYLIAGLAAIKVSDAKEMAGGAEDYEVTITHTFVDGLLAALTGGIYTPTTTIIKK